MHVGLGSYQNPIYQHPAEVLAGKKSCLIRIDSSQHTSGEKSAHASTGKGIKKQVSFLFKYHGINLELKRTGLLFMGHKTDAKDALQLFLTQSIPGWRDH